MYSRRLLMSRIPGFCDAAGFLPKVSPAHVPANFADAVAITGILRAFRCNNDLSIENINHTFFADNPAAHRLWARCVVRAWAIGTSPDGLDH